MINYSIFSTAKSLPKEWDTLVEHDIFLQSNYLHALEKAAPNNISLYYVGFYNESTLVGIAIIQRVQLYLNDIFRNKDDTCFRERFKKAISKILKGNVLVVGNLTHTGQHGLFIDTNKETYDGFLPVLFTALDQLKKEIRERHHKKIRAYLLKDYFETDDILNHSQFFEASGFYKVSVQPNMIMAIHNHWKQLDDYIGDLHKKYRDRYKTARRKANKIVKRELQLQEIEAASSSLYQLYKNVSDNARINTFILPENHFLEYKKQLGDAFKVYGYYSDTKMVGFYSLLLNNNVLETYFLGYDTQYQYDHQLYLNMLYDMAQFGIENSLKSIVYARTAMEIKSSVGAKPQKMVMFLKHTNWLLNTLLRTIFALMNPSQEWQERHPFK